jgi:hypothetical protein
MNSPPHTNLFTQVDRTKDPDLFVRFMDEAQKPARIQASKRVMLERMALAPGALHAELRPSASQTRTRTATRSCDASGAYGQSMSTVAHAAAPPERQPMPATCKPVGKCV